MMKKLLTIIIFIASAAVAVAQTPQQIVSRMEAEMNKHENDGVVMFMDIKIPIVGTMTTKTYSLGHKMRAEMEVKGAKIITWNDDKTSWVYNSKTNEVEIKKQEADLESEGDVGMFSGITEGYDVTIDEETTTEWHLLCKKSKSNKDNDAPKKMDLVIAKGTYIPVSLRVKTKGVTMTMRDVSFGVTEKQVAFNKADYPGVTVVDNR